MAALFVGYSSTNTSTTNSTTLYDIDLINQDLYYAFNTRIGERVMRPGWGCKIWDYLMEPSSEVLRDDIVNEATRICEEDTRLSVDNVMVYEQDNGIRVEINLLYIPYNVIDTFTASFNTRQETYMQGNS